MKVWKRNVVVAAILLFVCAAVYLNWSYSREVEEGAQTADGRLLGEAALVGGTTDDELLSGESEGEGDQGQEPGQAQGQAAKTGYFSSARLNRQQARDSALALLQQAAADEAADQTIIDQANESIQTMAANTLSEAQIENLVTAKGYADCVCFIGDQSVSVVVAAAVDGLTDTDTARIMEIVKEQTGRPAAQIKIIPAAQ